MLLQERACCASLPAGGLAHPVVAGVRAHKRLTGLGVLGANEFPGVRRAHADVSQSRVFRLPFRRPRVAGLIPVWSSRSGCESSGSCHSCRQ